MATNLTPFHVEVVAVGPRGERVLHNAIFSTGSREEAGAWGCRRVPECRGDYPHSTYSIRVYVDGTSFALDPDIK